ncbi:MAG: peptidoglycan DD-metalloendopeptidase family protein [Gammaproteobacteria bacterium]|nr:peptidoglycan DD-metalloendopeptidase family protein [Gammaproteobacteria bacterium]
MKQTSNTLLFANGYGQIRSVAFNPLHASLLVLIGIIVISGSILFSGFRAGINTEARHQLSEVAALRQLLQQQQTKIVQVRKIAQDNLDALTLRLGRMQAQMLRLDILGERLVLQADLDAAEFNFNMPPSMGGPQNAATLSTMTVPDFLGMLEELDMTAEDRKTKLMVLEQLIMKRHLQERIVPSGRAVEHGVLSSKFGKRIGPFTGKQEYHKGIDISSKEGSRILAVADGVVTWSGERTSYGNLVEINHGNGDVTRYGHNQQQLVKVGDMVRKGEAIALMGSTGRSTGPHVHIEVMHNGKQVNPDKYLNN